jgi:enterochelin esterase family protein
MTDWERRRAIPAPGPLTLEFPENAWIEYAWLDGSGQPFADPDNPKLSNNPWWTYPRAVETGSYPFHPDLAPVPSLSGSIERLSWPGGVFPGTRRAYLYRPPAAQDPLPIFYVQDGIAFYRTGKLQEVYEALWRKGALLPAAFVFIEPADRTEEYYLNDRYLDFLVKEVFPRAEERLGAPLWRGLWGASLGGLASLYLAWKHGELFRRVVTHSAALRAEPGDPDRDAVHAPEWLLGQLTAEPPTHLRISADVGLLEWLLPANRRLAALLAETEVAHRYLEQPSGHNWVTWRNALPAALRFQLGRDLPA